MTLLSKACSDPSLVLCGQRYQQRPVSMRTVSVACCSPAVSVCRKAFQGEKVLVVRCGSWLLLDPVLVTWAFFLSLLSLP